MKMGSSSPSTLLCEARVPPMPTPLERGLTLWFMDDKGDIALEGMEMPEVSTERVIVAGRVLEDEGLYSLEVSSMSLHVLWSVVLSAA